MKWLKKVLIATIAAAIALSLSISAFAAQPETGDMVSESVDRGRKVIRVDIPNEDGTYTTLEGAEAQAWYDNVVAKAKQREAEDVAWLAMNEDETEVGGSLSGPFLIGIVILSLSVLMMLKGQHWKKQ